MVQWLRCLIGVGFLDLLSAMSEVVLLRAVKVQQGRLTSFPKEETTEQRFPHTELPLVRVNSPVSASFSVWMLPEANLLILPFCF